MSKKPKGPSRKELAGYSAYIEHLMEALHLTGGYDFYVGYCRKDRGAYATVEVDAVHKTARFTIYPQFFDLDADGQQETLLHEVLHVTQRGLIGVVNGLLGAMELPQREGALFHEAFRQQWEAQADHLARALHGKI